MTKTYRYYLRDGIPRRESITMHGGQVFMHSDPFNAQTDTEITAQGYDDAKAQRRETLSDEFGNAKEQARLFGITKKNDMAALKAELESLGVTPQLLWVLD